jgi:ankyrin repeat protein
MSMGDPNAIDQRGVSRLLAAVGSGNLDRVRALLESGANPDAPGVARSPLVTAITQLDTQSRKLYCNIEMVHLLLDFGADPNMPDPSVDTRPINKALELGAAQCAMLLKDKGARINGFDPAGRTVLDSAVAGAVHARDLSLIDLALRWGISPNARSRNGSSALITAVWLDSAAAFQFLLQRGVDPCITQSNDTKNRPLDFARALKRSDDIVRLLEDATRCDTRRARLGS